MNEKKIAEDAKTARALGLDYGTYMEYVRSGYIDTYKRIKFHEETKRNAEDWKLEPSNIGRSGSGYDHDRTIITI